MQYNDLSTIRTIYNKFCFVTLCYKLLSKKDEIKGYLVPKRPKIFLLYKI